MFLANHCSVARPILEGSFEFLDFDAMLKGEEKTCENWEFVNNDDYITSVVGPGCKFYMISKLNEIWYLCTI